MEKKILIVDDEVGIRLLLEDLLGSEGHGVYTAQTGKEALDLLQVHTIDLLIMDYKLPILDGIEVLKQLEREKIDIPTIVMSGLVENIKDEIITFPIVKKVLSKPFNVLEVREFVNQLLA
ncbi:response regulator [Ornithinibacillus xuwenensis]|uniref:Response regulator n=1 Tax=Ornithinibacillus xuwenensis TaxID=3144668 RepID=A0ABU9XG60_9BACI